MSSCWYVIDVSKSREELSPLLPHIAGVIENVEQATFADIKNQLERDLEKKVSDTEIVKALENGMKLGVFNMEREFKVCREFSTREIKRLNLGEDETNEELYESTHCSSGPDRDLMSYVRNQREERKNKMFRKGKRGKSAFASKCIKGNVQLYRYLCEQCKRSVEREMVDNETSSSEEENEKGSAPSVVSLDGSSKSGESGMRTKFSEEHDKPPEKSRLLVEKNPMETDPPYYDIFT